MQPRDVHEWDRDADLQTVRETYDRYGQTGRGRLWNPQAPGYKRLADELQLDVVQAIDRSLDASSARVLDLGCGDGGLAGDVDAEGRQLEWVGIDLRPQAVADARARFPSLTFEVASADAVPLDSQSIDVIVARLLFSSLPSPRLESAVAAEITRLLRPAGSLVWLDLRYANPANPSVHGLPLSRIRKLFPGWAIALRTAGLLPPVARRLGWTASFTYPVLASLPPLRSHLVGRLQPTNTSS